MCRYSLIRATGVGDNALHEDGRQSRSSRMAASIPGETAFCPGASATSMQDVPHISVNFNNKYRHIAELAFEETSLLSDHTAQRDRSRAIESLSALSERRRLTPRLMVWSLG